MCSPTPEGVESGQEKKDPDLGFQAKGLVDMAGIYSNRTDLLDDFAELRRRLQASGPRQSKPSPAPRSSGGPKKQLASDEAATIVAKYEAGASMAQLKMEHHMAKRTVAKVLREAGVVVRPRGGQHRRSAS
ncbi:helix-turn-helix domain-containing protein [Nocardia terpenica]|nr:hypothetical protein [Nocardia terpenica]NQE91012.1 hypothetical protein [Nocardia terpenica]